MVFKNLMLGDVLALKGKYNNVILEDVTGSVASLVSK